MTTSLIEASGPESEALYCANMNLLAEKIIDIYPENKHIELHQRFTSICFYLKVVNETYQSIEKINRDIYFENGYNQEQLYRCLIQYISSMDSVLDLLEKGSIKLSLNSVKRFERSQLKYNSILNTIRNFLMHDGIPFCRIDKNNSQGYVFQCADIAPIIEDKVSFSLKIIFNSEKLQKDTFSLDDLLAIYKQFKQDIESYLALVLTDKKMI